MRCSPGWMQRIWRARKGEGWLLELGDWRLRLVARGLLQLNKVSVSSRSLEREQTAGQDVLSRSTSEAASFLSLSSSLSSSTGLASGSSTSAADGGS